MVHFTTLVQIFSIIVISLLQFSCSQKAYSNVSCIARERRALFQLRNGLIDGSNQLSSWIGEDCCNWEGVGCNKNTGHVVKLDLHSPNFEWNNGLQGEINSSLLALKHLNYLDLSMNNFSGFQIPVFFGSLKNLKYLNLSLSGFNGNIPHELGNLSHLQHLDLSNLDLTAESLSWVARLSTLKSLDLSAVNLNGSQDRFQSINMLPSLMSLKLSGCRLFFSPNPQHVNLTSLSVLDLSENGLLSENDNNSTIPLWLFNMTSLKYLDLSNNYFQVSQDSVQAIINLNSLKYLDLSNNYFQVSQDSVQAIINLNSLKSLNLRYCGLRFLPNTPHVNLTSLTLLDLSGNGLSSNIPLWLFNITSLKHLYLYDNFFSLIPAQISQLTSLTSLVLGINKFGGSLPLGLLCNQTSLSVLDLRENKFQGSIPSEIGCFRQLVELQLSENELNGTIHSNLGLLTNLEALYISSNSLTGEMSEVHFANLKKLKYLDLRSNSLTLKVSSSWIPPFQLQELWMRDVKIGPYFPSWLQTQRNLTILSMKNSSISDAIPSWFEILHSQIEYLDLSVNNLIGKIPKFLDMRSRQRESYFLRQILLYSNKFEATPYRFPSDINNLDLSSNIITGPIPETICQIRTLEKLDLSNNKLSGRLPLCLGKMQYLIALSLGNNNLYGQIPSSMGNIEFLQFLSLGNNKFHGKLPPSMQYLTRMLFLDLGENELEGIIPSWIGDHLSSLRILRLSSNHFYGEVPVHLCQLSKLQVLNLAQNKLTGSIPRCFNNFTAMGPNYIQPLVYTNNENFYVSLVVEKLHSYMGGRELEYFDSNVRLLKSLDLSQNNIIGGIPNELMDLMGLQSLNLSRNNLSGNIPRKIGNLKQLLSLDLSMNEFSGSLPPGLANLNFLTFLNLSWNKLSGRIPTGNQLQTLDNPSIYAGNNGLCGKPLPKNCSDDKSSEENEPSFGHKDDMESIFSWFYAGLGPGLVVGILVIICTLLFKKSWRIAYFQYVENFSNNISVWIVLKISKLGRKLP